jgi:hypothetical protein
MAMATFDLPAGIQFRRPASDVQRFDPSGLQYLQYQFQRFHAHTFQPVWAGIYVTVLAGLVASIAHVDLQDVQRGSSDGGEV